jgi:serine/threonine protein phosphatase PrpC
MDALGDTWLLMENNLREVLSGGREIYRDGSTATVCLIVGTTIYITNCGDSQAYIQMTDGEFTAATDIHNTCNEEEVARCTAAGGRILLKHRPERTTYFCCCFPQYEPALNQPRLYPGGLLVTRSFGDFYAKEKKLGGLPGNLICQYGQIRVFSSIDLKYIVLASDGVWDALTPKEVFDIIINHFETRKERRKQLPSSISLDALSLK